METIKLNKIKSYIYFEEIKYFVRYTDFLLEKINFVLDTCYCYYSYNLWREKDYLLLRGP